MIPIQIREEEKSIPSKAVMEFLNNRGVIKKKDKNYFFDSSKKIYTKKEIEQKLREIGVKPNSLFKTELESLNLDISDEVFLLVHGGIFIVKAEFSQGDIKSFEKSIEKRGLWNAQGINNHVHINSYTACPVTQLFLAKKIVEIWSIMLEKLDGDIEAIIYVNGKVDTTVCIYSNSGVDDSFLGEFDDRLGITKLNIDYLNK